MEKVNSATGRTILSLAKPKDELGGSAASAEAHKVASCEISDVAAASERPGFVPADDQDSDQAAAVALAAGADPQTPDTAAPDEAAELSSTPPHLSLDEAYAELVAAREVRGPLSVTKTSWTPKAVKVLKASLLVSLSLGGNVEARDDMRRRLKKENGRRRALNRNNLDLIAIQGCYEDVQEEQRKELSRFANVVMVARHENVQPDHAEAWLKSKKQANILESARALKGQKPRSKPVVAASATSRSHIWNALQSGKGAQYDLAVEWLDDLDAMLEREAQSVPTAAPDKPKPGHPDEMTTDNAAAKAEHTQALAEPVTDA